ncbi:hypothetical protein NQ317_004806, partial [Molorchus minor]
MVEDFNRIFNCFGSIFLCFMLSVTYLASIHVWNSPYNRDHPITIKKKIRQCICYVIRCTMLSVCRNKKDILEKVSMWEILGLKTEGLCQAIFMPLFLTMILFLGPMSMELYSGLSKLYTEEMYWFSNVTNLIWIRNHIAAPFSEEFTYRCCMLPLLLQNFKPTTAIIISPLFFGVGFQFVYTTIFGMYSSYLFYRTGHFISLFVVHAFCNHMGFPEVTEIGTYKQNKKIIISSLFVAGFVLDHVIVVLEGHSGVQRNEEADRLAREGSAMYPIGPEPILGVPYSMGVSAMKELLTKEFKNSWHVTLGMQQAKTHIEGPSLKLTKCLVIGIAEDPKCLEDEETLSHVLTE